MPETEADRRLAYTILAGVVAKATCKPGWHFRLIPEAGTLRLVISVEGPDAASPEQTLTIRHSFPVPVATYNERTWRRWVFECCRGVENHEIGEWFRIDGELPFAPLHGPGENPYMVHEFRQDIDRRTRQDGTVREE